MSCTTLVVTNDFPPRLGGIEGFVAAACTALADDVVVLTRTEPALDTRRFDAALPYEVVRIPGPLLPSPAVQRRAAALMRERNAVRILYGAAAPLGLLAHALRREGAEHQLGLTHGHEVWWAKVPGARTLLARIAGGLDHIGVISTFTSRMIGAALPESARAKLVMIPPPVDLDRFAPAPVGPRPGPIVVASGRLIAQKGFDSLLDIWPIVRACVGEAELRIVGHGPRAPRLSARASHLNGVSLVGATPYSQMPHVLRQAALFALPVRARLGGLNSEGLGRVFLEAAATGLPVVVGDSGGAPETVIDGVTGTVVDPHDKAALTRAIIHWLSEPEQARVAGLAGRAHVAAQFGLTQVGATLRRCLDVEASGLNNHDE